MARQWWWATSTLCWMCPFYFLSPFFSSCIWEGHLFWERSDQRWALRYKRMRTPGLSYANKLSQLKNFFFFTAPGLSFKTRPTEFSLPCFIAASSSFHLFFTVFLPPATVYYIKMPESGYTAGVLRGCLRTACVVSLLLCGASDTLCIPLLVVTNATDHITPSRTPLTHTEISREREKHS